MAVFGYGGLARINKILNDKFERMVNAQPCDLKPDQFLQAFGRIEHRQLLRAARHLTVRDRHYSVIAHARIVVPGGKLRGVVHLQDIDFLLPTYMATLRAGGYQDPEAAGLITAWFSDLHELIREIVNVKACLGFANDLCTDAAQLGAFMPALATYLRGKEDDDPKTSKYNDTFRHDDGTGWSRSEFADFSRNRKRLLKGGAPKTLPPVPRDVIAACRDANTFLLRTALTLEAFEADRPAIPPGGHVSMAIDLGSSAQPPMCFQQFVGGVCANYLPQTVNLNPERFDCE